MVYLIYLLTKLGDPQIGGSKTLVKANDSKKGLFRYIRKGRPMAKKKK